eukprot:g20096.t1
MEHLLRFVLAAGDNFYSGCTPAKMLGVWLGRYPQVLTCVPWYAILGNHDYDLAPYNTYNTVRSQTNGSVEFVKTKRECTGGYNACWAMPAANFVVRAWEESLGLTIVGTDANGKYAGYPFSEGKFSGGEKGAMLALQAQGQALLRQSLIAEDSAKNILVFNHYPWGDVAGLYGGTLNAAAAKGKNVYFFAGHVHTTNDPVSMGWNTPGGVKTIIAGAAGGYCSDECGGGLAAVVFGMVKIDGTLQFERVPGPGVPVAGCHG